MKTSWDEEESISFAANILCGRAARPLDANSWLSVITVVVGEHLYVFRLRLDQLAALQSELVGLQEGEIDGCWITTQKRQYELSGLVSTQLIQSNRRLQTGVRIAVDILGIIDAMERTESRPRMRRLRGRSCQRPIPAHGTGSCMRGRYPRRARRRCELSTRDGLLYDDTGTNDEEHKAVS
ncbi:uncharacterized protein BCR38DRAFT_163214 [Pseudomassariella vexata]|uniref:Uncharacterized protein n=1 Tax=Pseudomassariella vexata TaxID=1141098 RepID=A0A1Y2E841_9PEZI|nr:uncharacterized protein BCR38DRAFT_163214 [Pseudomassariella vexata]ORY67702.1 hypothetical protein BCR38DRAFT_163214 [Pseudomassariella vexata]